MYADKLKLQNASFIEDEDREPGRYLVKASSRSEWELVKWDGSWVIECGGFDKDAGIYDAFVVFGPLP